MSESELNLIKQINKKMIVYLDSNNWITTDIRNAVAKAEITKPQYNSIKQCFEYQILSLCR